MSTGEATAQKGHDAFKADSNLDKEATPTPIEHESFSNRRPGASEAEEIADPVTVRPGYQVLGITPRKGSEKS